MEESIPVQSLITQAGVQEFLLAHENEDAKNIVLKYAGKVDFDLAPITQQIELRQKARKKISSFITPYTVLLPKLFEQSTHQEAAKYKATLINGNTYLDATTGLGIDTFFIGKNFKRIVCLEADPRHAEILVHNYKQLDVHAEIHHTTLEEFLKINEAVFDVIYIDPDRRPDADRKYFEIEQCTPNVIALKEELLHIAKEVWIKLSPMMDIHSIIQNFSPNIKNIVAIAYQNEMKELLISLMPGEHEIKYTATNIGTKTTDSFTSEDINAKPILSPASAYFFEPNVALVKSKLCMEYAKNNGLNILYPNGYYFTTDTIVEGLQGRLFEIEEAMPYKKELLNAFIKKHAIKKANISCRNFFWKPDDVKKQFKLSDGGEWYLFCYSSADKKPMAIWSTRIKGLIA